MNTKCLLKWLILIVLSLVVFSQYTFAKDKVYSVGVETLKYFPQFTYVNGEFGGFGKAILDAFSKKKGYQFIYKARPVARLNIEFLKNNHFDFRYPENSYWTPEMKKGKVITYSSPVVEFIDGVMVKPTRKGMGIETLKKLGTIRNFTPWPYLSMINSKKIILTESDSLPSLLKMALRDRVDGAYINVSVAQYQLNHILQKPNDLIFNPDLPYVKSYYHLATIKHPNIIEEFNQFLLQEKDLIDRLKKKFKVENSTN